MPATIPKSAASAPDAAHVTAPLWPETPGEAEVQAVFSGTVALARPVTVRLSGTSVTLTWTVRVAVSGGAPPSEAVTSTVYEVFVS